MATEVPRETSSATTRLVLGYVREQAGDAAVQRVLDAATVPHTLAELEDPAHWVSYDTRCRLFRAAVDVLHDPAAMHAVGASVIAHADINSSLMLVLQALGSPAQVYRQLPRAVSKFSTTSTMTVVECARTSATLEFRLHDGYPHERLDCDYARGLIGSIPGLFGLPPAHLVHEVCQSDGADSCVYHVTWSRRRRFSRGRRAEDLELVALRAQLSDLQSASADLVSGEELHEVLANITRRAASSVLARGYLLAVLPADGGPALVQSTGVPAADVDRLAQQLLAGDDLGPHAVVVDVESARRRHGRLAALYAEGQVGLRDERRLLAAYASHAAAALDLLGALQDSRRDGARSLALLELAHQLAGASDPDEVARLVAAALPGAVGCDRGAVMLWDPVAGELLTVAAYEPELQAVPAPAPTPLRTNEIPELVEVVTLRRPVLLDAEEASPQLRAVMAELSVRAFVGVPLLVSDELLGVVVASWRDDLPAGHAEDLTLRLSGVADQAATALQGARLLTTVRHQALHDALTGLPNRVLFSDRLEEALGTGSCGAVLFCDLDRFKQVNDALGHAAGDELLRQLAARLLCALPDGATVGRLSGDEFAVLLPLDVDARAAAERVVECFERPFRVDGHELRVTGSVGVAAAAPDLRPDRLLRLADGAMYEAKQRGRNQISVAHAAAAPAGAPVPSLEHELRTGIADGQLRLVYQPVLRLADDWSGDPGDCEVVGVEALVRWQHPRLGLLSPDVFLPIAEDSGLIVEVDLWAVREATRALAACPEPGPARVAVNLSGRSLSDSRLRPAVLDALQASGLAPCRLELEVVESRALFDLPGVVEQLTALRHLGLRIALDDFGTGYSTLTWLQQLPADRLKLDRTFTASLSDGPHGHALVRGVVALAGELGLDVVGEGVETPEQLQALFREGCRLFQGFLLGRPGPLACTAAVGG